MVIVRPSDERGYFDHGWLKTRHSFSFGAYYDPRHLGFRTLRVINEDQIAAGRGFGTHPHRDMEILTWVLAGRLRHADSMGNSAEIGRHEIQRITAGRGIEHSEHNASATEPVHLLQIWLLPREQGLTPGYEERTFTDEALQGRLAAVASPDGREDSVTIQQDASLLIGRLAPGDAVAHALGPGRSAWVQVAEGAVALNDTALAQGDGAAVSGETELHLTAGEPSEILLFDLA